MPTWTRTIALAALLTAGCGLAPPPGAAARPFTGARTAGLWNGQTPALKANPTVNRVAIDGLDTPFIKDPSFVDGGRPVAGNRYIAFGDLRSLYVKAFDVDGQGGPLAFRRGETRLTLAGVPEGLDAPWAPQLRVVGGDLELLYCDGSMPPGQELRWPTFRLRHAKASVAAFNAAVATGQSPVFQDQGVLMGDIAPFGPNDQDFGVIDPSLFINAHGRAYLTYTVVRDGIPGKRAYEEFVRCRPVDPADLTRSLGPDKLLYAGHAGTEDDGVAEASDLVTLGGRTYAFISSRPGDQDQRLLVAEIGEDPGALDRDHLHEFFYAGVEPWRMLAVGSSSAADIGGTPYMVFQALGKDRRFSLGWTTLAR